VSGRRRASAGCEWRELRDRSHGVVKTYTYIDLPYSVPFIAYHVTEEDLILAALDRRVIKAVIENDGT
jgi:hypothetical protein